MEVSNWQFAQRFEDIRQRAGRFSRERKDVLNDKSVPLISWRGNTEDFDWLCDQNKSPPADVLNVERARPHEEFVCWLMLPINYEKKWYFGRVYSQRRSVTEELRAFRAIASEAGGLLQRDGLFSKYLSPCVAHVNLASRFPAFNDHVAASYWCALLFTRPDFHVRITFPFENTIAGDGIAEASIFDPFRLTAEAIRHWRLNLSKPNPATGRVAPPYQWPEAMPSGEQQPPNANGSRLKTGLLPYGWHTTPLCGTLKKLAEWENTSTVTLNAHALKGVTWRIVPWGGKDDQTGWLTPFAIYYPSIEKFGTANKRYLADVKKRLAEIETKKQ